MRRVHRVLVGAAAVLGGIAAVPAQSEASPVPASRAARPHYTYDGVKFVYRKHGCVAVGCRAELTYVYDAIYHRPDRPPVVSRRRATWRAGSGVGTGDCAVGEGWIPNSKQPGPNNRYRLRFHAHYPGTLIHGTVLAIHNKTYGGALVANCNRDRGWERSELFIHSEMTVDGGQVCGSGDLSTCWEGEHDYYSEGCIKVSYRNMKGPGRPDRGTVAWYWQHRGGHNGIPLTVKN